MMTSPLEPDAGDPLRVARFFVGGVLVAMGGAAGVWTFAQLYLLIAGAEPPAIIQRLIPSDPQARTILYNQQPIEIPEKAFAIGGYGVSAVLLMVCSGLAIGVIRAGADLLIGRPSRPSTDETPERQGSRRNAVDG
jgi:hypothetical protein